MMKGHMERMTVSVTAAILTGCLLSGTAYAEDTANTPDMENIADTDRDEIDHTVFMIEDPEETVLTDRQLDAAYISIEDSGQAVLSGDADSSIAMVFVEQADTLEISGEFSVEYIVISGTVETLTIDVDCTVMNLTEEAIEYTNSEGETVTVKAGTTWVEEGDSTAKKSGAGSSGGSSSSRKSGSGSSGSASSSRKSGSSSSGSSGSSSRKTSSSSSGSSSRKSSSSSSGSTDAVETEVDTDTTQTEADTSTDQASSDSNSEVTETEDTGVTETEETGIVSDAEATEDTATSEQDAADEASSVETDAVEDTSQTEASDETEAAVEKIAVPLPKITPDLEDTEFYTIVSNTIDWENAGTYEIILKLVDGDHYYWEEAEEPDSDEYVITFTITEVNADN